MRVYESMSLALEDCCDHVWAILDVTANQLNDQSRCETWTMEDEDIPSVAIRMRPSTLPDTRNFMYVYHCDRRVGVTLCRWSSRRTILPRVESGQLLYFISGFLSIQIEVHNFLASFRKSNRKILQIDSEVFEEGNSKNWKEIYTAVVDSAHALGAWNTSNYNYSMGALVAALKQVCNC